jgi:hypothetical protein
MTLTKIATLVVVTLAAVAHPNHSDARNFYLTPGVGMGVMKNSIGPAGGLSGTYRAGGPSLTARVNYAQEITIFESSGDHATEFALMVGFDNFDEKGASVGVDFGIGWIESVNRGQILGRGLFSTRYEKIRVTTWGLAAQAEVFFTRRFGIVVHGNFNRSVSFICALLSVRLGGVGPK